MAKRLIKLVGYRSTDMKRHQIITLIFLLWITLIAVQIEQKVHQHAWAAVEQYWEVNQVGEPTGKHEQPCESSEVPGTFALTIKCVGDQLFPLLNPSF